MDESSPAESSNVELPLPSQPAAVIPEVTFQGNNYDLVAVVGATVGGVVLLTCGTCNLGIYVLPFAPIILGIIGLITAKDSVNPERTKLLSWLSLGAGGIILLLAIVLIIAYIVFIGFVVAMEGKGFD